MAIVVMLMAPRDDLVEKLSETRFVIEQAAAGATAVTAAIAAFFLVIPGHSRKLALLPIFPLAIWLGSLGFGCLQSWLQFGTEAWQINPDWICFPSTIGRASIREKVCQYGEILVVA